ncbi:MAG TPA: hypothetical protein VM163_03810 [bacterium]|nr:hypothetical protein [bacterium]
MSSMLGLLLFVTLSVVFGGIALLLLGSLGLFSRRFRFWAETLWTVLSVSVPRMFHELLNDSYFWRPDLKCVVSGKLFRFSPAFSGIVFKYFNLIVLGVLFGFVALLIGAIVGVINGWG